jgi:Flp pilus assembly protein TadG
MKHKFNSISNQKGAIFVETLIAAPLMIMIFLFCVDFLMFTKSHTFVSQVARDAAIYFATIPGEPEQGQETNLYKHNEYNDLILLCSNEEEQVDPMCYHLATQVRAFRSLQAGSGNLDIQDLNMTTSYDGNNVTLEISADVKISFWWNTSTVNTSATLRKVNL